MSSAIQAVRGMNDVLPTYTHKWRQVEQLFQQCLAQYGYQEIRMPLLENTSLFKRTIGEQTDIVEKEMYTFNDLNGDSLSLRPEGTAGCVRACIEHGLLHNQQQKLWYLGPMFRHEKPQKGRYRQFTQLGVEAFGFSGVAIELELFAICARLWKLLDVTDAVHLHVNTLGNLAERHVYREQLVSYFRAHYDDLDEDSQRRLDKNPLRLLDSKNPAMQSLIAAAPKLIDVISDDNRNDFQDLCLGLDQLGISYTINPSLVRGLDYYGGLVFEWVTEALGSQSTVCAGGRYDALVEQFSGPASPAIGFAIGLERLLLLMEATHSQLIQPQPPFFFVIAVGEAALKQAVLLSETIRNANTSWTVLVNTSGGSFKSQFKKADKSGAQVALILGEEEVFQQAVSIKPLRYTGEQLTIPQTHVIQHLQQMS